MKFSFYRSLILSSCLGALLIITSCSDDPGTTDESTDTDSAPETDTDLSISATSTATSGDTSSSTDSQTATETDSATGTDILPRPEPVVSSSEKHVRWLSPKGKDEGACVYEAPCLTIEFAISVAKRGDRIALFAGRYKPETTILLNNGMMFQGGFYLANGELRSGNPAERTVIDLGDKHSLLVKPRDALDRSPVTLLHLDLIGGSSFGPTPVDNSKPSTTTSSDSTETTAEDSPEGSHLQRMLGKKGPGFLSISGTTSSTTTTSGSAGADSHTIGTEDYLNTAVATGTSVSSTSGISIGGTSSTGYGSTGSTSSSSSDGGLAMEIVFPAKLEIVNTADLLVSHVTVAVTGNGIGMAALIGTDKNDIKSHVAIDNSEFVIKNFADSGSALHFSSPLSIYSQNGDLDLSVTDSLIDCGDLGSADELLCRGLVILKNTGKLRTNIVHNKFLGGLTGKPDKFHSNVIVGMVSKNADDHIDIVDNYFMMDSAQGSTAITTYGAKDLQIQNNIIKMGPQLHDGSGIMVMQTEDIESRLVVGQNLMLFAGAKFATGIDTTGMNASLYRNTLLLGKADTAVGIRMTGSADGARLFVGNNVLASHADMMMSIWIKDSPAATCTSGTCTQITSLHHNAVYNGDKASYYSDGAAADLSSYASCVSAGNTTSRSISSGECLSEYLSATLPDSHVLGNISDNPMITVTDKGRVILDPASPLIDGGKRAMKLNKGGIRPKHGKAVSEKTTEESEYLTESLNPIPEEQDTAASQQTKRKPTNRRQDIYGNNRFVDGDGDGKIAIDIGAVEFQTSSTESSESEVTTETATDDVLDEEISE